MLISITIIGTLFVTVGAIVTTTPAMEPLSSKKMEVGNRAIIYKTACLPSSPVKIWGYPLNITTNDSSLLWDVLAIPFHNGC